MKDLWDKYQEKDAQTATNIKKMINKWFESDREEMFDELLAVVSNNFMDWRYVYEWKDAKTNILFLKGLRLLLKEECCEQFFGKTWNEFVNTKVEELMVNG